MPQTWYWEVGTTDRQLWWGKGLRGNLVMFVVTEGGCNLTITIGNWTYHTTPHIFLLSCLEFSRALTFVENFSIGNLRLWFTRWMIIPCALCNLHLQKNNTCADLPFPLSTPGWNALVERNDFPTPLPAVRHTSTPKPAFPSPDTNHTTKSAKGTSRKWLSLDETANCSTYLLMPW